MQLVICLIRAQEHDFQVGQVLALSHQHKKANNERTCPFLFVTAGLIRLPHPLKYALSQAIFACMGFVSPGATHRQPEWVATSSACEMQTQSWPTMSKIKEQHASIQEARNKRLAELELELQTWRECSYCSLSYPPHILDENGLCPSCLCHGIQVSTCSDCQSRYPHKHDENSGQCPECRMPWYLQ